METQSSITQEMKKELQGLCESVLFDEALSRYTTIRVGGPADVLAYPKTIDEITALLVYARQKKLPVFVLGAGSNILVRDGGIRGVVMNLSKSFGQVRVEKETDDEVSLYVEAGVGIPRLVDFTVEQGLTGLEPIAGIPGNVGGGLVMNAGTPDGDIGSFMESVSFVDKDGRLLTWLPKQVKFDYRESHFPRGAVIVSARFKLKRSASDKIKAKVQKYRADRVETQPLNIPSLGSVFKNPKEKKVFAGKLVEEAGLKDVRVGGARVSPKHANWIVNEGGAKAKDVIALIGLIRDKVKEKFGILLETEVKTVGEE